MFDEFLLFALGEGGGGEELFGLSGLGILGEGFLAFGEGGDVVLESLSDALEGSFVWLDAKLELEPSCEDVHD